MTLLPNRPKIKIPIIRFTCLSFILILFCLGCGHKPKEVIRVWEFPRWREGDELDRFSWIKRKIAEFEGSNSHVDVELVELTWERGEDKIRIAVAAGQGPDITTGTLPIRYIEEGLIEPIDNYLTKDDYLDLYGGSLKGYQYKGRTYGWPWFMTGGVMFLNLDLFEEKGVLPPKDGRWTYDEFVEKMGRLTYDSDRDGLIDTYGFGFTITPGDTTSWPFLYSDGARPLSDDLRKYTFNSPEAISGLKKLSDLVNLYKVTPPGCGGMTEADLWQLFFKQKRVAAAPWGMWALAALNKEKPFRFQVAHFPTGSSGDPISFIGTSGFIVFKQPNKERQDICMKLSKFLTSGENQKALSAYGVFPTRRSAGNIYPDDPWMTSAQGVLLNGVTVPPHPEWSRIDEKIQRQIQLALLAEKSVTSALDEAGKEIESILKGSEIPRKSGPGHLWDHIPGMVGLGGVVLLIFFVILILSPFSLRYTWAYLFILPSLLVFVIFLGFPLLRAFLLAFQDYKIGQGMFAGWVGLENFKEIFRDKIFWKALINTLIYTGLTVTANLLVALILASLIHPLSSKLKAFFRAAYYLPGVACLVVISMVWRWLYDPNFGLVNQILGGLGIGPIQWLADPGIALASVILTGLLRTPGGPILIYLAAMEAIPPSLYEVSKIDGAGPIRRWWSITLPLLTPTTLFLLVTLTIASFQVFTQVLILTDGGPGYATTVLVHRIYNTAFRDFEFGLASAMALILFVILILISIIQFRFFKSHWEY